MTTIFKSRRSVGLLAFVASAAFAQSLDQSKVSYAVGMNLGLQIKHHGAEVDIKAIGAGLKDVLEGRPPRLTDEQVRALFKQEAAWEKRISVK